MRLSEHTLNALEQVSRIAHLDNRTTAVRFCADLALAIMEAINEGSKIVIEKQNGEKERILITGQ